MLAGVTFQPSDAFQQVRVAQPSYAQPRSSSWRNRFAASPVSRRLRHLASVSKSPPLRLIFSHSREKAGTTKSSCTAFQTCSSSAPPFSRDTLAGRTVGDVASPRRVGRGRGEVAIQKVRRNRQIMPAVGGGDAKAPLAASPNPAPMPLHTLLTHADALSSQSAQDARPTVGSTIRCICCAYMHQQRFVVQVEALGYLPVPRQMLMITGDAYAEYAAIAPGSSKVACGVQ